MVDPDDESKRQRRLEGLGTAFLSSRHFAFAIALVLALIEWNGLERDEGAFLPWTFHNVLTGLTFFLVFGIAWGLGALGGVLGWSIGRRRGRARLGAVAGVAGLWVGAGLGLLLWLATPDAARPTTILLRFVLPLLGPWIAVRWLADPVARMLARARSALLGLSRFLSEWLVLKGPVRFDARGLALGLVAGLLIGAAEAAGAFDYLEAVLLAERIHLRNEPINTAAGPIDLSRWISLQGPAPHASLPPPRDRGLVILQMDDWTEARLMTTTSEPALNAHLLRKLREWQSGPIVLPVSSTALTTASERESRRAGGVPRFSRRRSRPTSPPPPPQPRNPKSEIRNPKSPGPSVAALNPANPPLDEEALRRAARDLPALQAALRQSDRAMLCLLSPPPPPSRRSLGVLLSLLRGLPENVPLPRIESQRVLPLLLASGRPAGSAQFEPFHVRQIQSLQLVDGDGRWALPLLLASGGNRGRVSPPPSRTLTGSLTVAGRKIPLAEAGQFLVNVYGSTPDAIFPIVSYSAVLTGERLYDRRVGRWVRPSEFFRDRIVFLDTLNQPTYNTPIGSLRATELLASATDNVLTMNVLEPPATEMELLFLLLFGALAGHLSIRRGPLSGAGRMAVLVAFYSLTSALLFVWPGLWLPTVSVVVAIGFAYLLVIQFVFTVDEMEIAHQRGERAHYEQEIAISRAIQTSLLPEGHLRAGAFEIVCRSDPAREVGGDFYNLFPLTANEGARCAVRGARPEEGAAGVGSSAGLLTGGADPEVGATSELARANEIATAAHRAPRTAHRAEGAPACDRIGIVLGDVSGKGVQGAMYMTVATTLLEARAEADVAPEAVLTVANTHLYPKIHRLRMFVTVFYGLLEVGSGQMEFASAGQVPPVLVRREAGADEEGRARYLRSRGVPLGALRDSRYERRSVCLDPGDTLVLASDGFIEARAPHGEPLGYRGFLEIVAHHADDEPQRCADGIFKEVQQFTGDAEDQDDRTLIVIRRHQTS